MYDSLTAYCFNKLHSCSISDFQFHAKLCNVFVLFRVMYYYFAYFISYFICYPCDLLYISGSINLQRLYFLLLWLNIDIQIACYWKFIPVNFCYKVYDEHAHSYRRLGGIHFKYSWGPLWISCFYLLNKAPNKASTEREWRRRGVCIRKVTPPPKTTHTLNHTYFSLFMKHQKPTFKIWNNLYSLLWYIIL